MRFRPLFQSTPIVLVLFIFIQSLMAQVTADDYIQALRKKMNNIKDYSVDAHIKVDMPFIKLLPVNAQFYFKQKNKFKVKSKNIALMPKQNFWQNLYFLEEKESYTAVLSGKEKLADVIELTIISIIPIQDTGDLILCKCWIDPLNNLIRKTQLSTRSNGTILTEYFYNSNNNIGLPDKLIFTVDIKKFKIPKGIVSDLNKSSASEDKSKKDRKTGKIEVILSNYKVNIGLKDEFFKP